eukprot:1181629-Prorocentrum_minimum.AAC.3
MVSFVGLIDYTEWKLRPNSAKPKLLFTLHQACGFPCAMNKGGVTWLITVYSLQEMGRGKNCTLLKLILGQLGLGNRCRLLIAASN